MATKQTTVDFICDQLVSVPGVSARKMFGEYAIYCDDRVVALVCDDVLFIKITPQGKSFAGKTYREGIPYPGAKPSMKIDGDQIEDGSWLSQLVHITAKNLPHPKSKKTQRKTHK